MYPLIVAAYRGVLGRVGNGVWGDISIIEGHRVRCSTLSWACFFLPHSIGANGCLPLGRKREVEVRLPLSEQLDGNLTSTHFHAGALALALLLGEEGVGNYLEVGAVSQLPAGLAVLEVPDDTLYGFTRRNGRSDGVRLSNSIACVPGNIVENGNPEPCVLELTFNICVRCVESAEVCNVAGGELELRANLVAEKFSLHPFARLEAVEYFCVAGVAVAVVLPCGAVECVLLDGIVAVSDADSASFNISPVRRDSALVHRDEAALC